MSESELQAAVLELAAHLGFLRAHFRPAQVRSGRWVTPMAGDVGFPDIVLAGNGRVIFAELKAKKGALSVAQTCWRDALIAAGQEWYLWRPVSWTSGAVEAALRDGHPGTATIGRLVRSA